MKASSPPQASSNGNTPIRSGRAEAWSVLVLLVGGPFLLFPIFGDALFQWIYVLHGSDQSKGIDERIKVWILLASSCLSCVFAIQIVLQILEHVLISCSSFIVTQPVDCGITPTSTLADNFCHRYRYEIRGKIYVKTLVTTMQSPPDPNSDLHVHPIRPQLSRHQNQMNKGALIVKIFVSLFANVCQLILFLYALIGLRDASAFEYTFGILFCLLAAALFVDFFRKQPNGRQAFMITPLIRDILLGAKMEASADDFLFPEGRPGQETSGYMAAP